MKLFQNEIIIAALLSIGLFMGGQYIFLSLFEFFEPRVDGISFLIVEQNRVIKTSVLFSLIVALIPMLTILIWRVGPIISTRERIYSLIIILVFSGVGIWLRHLEVKTFFNQVVKKLLLSNNGQRVIYPIDPVNIVYYMCGGLCVGGIVSYFLFRKNKINSN